MNNTYELIAKNIAQSVAANKLSSATQCSPGTIFDKCFDVLLEQVKTAHEHTDALTAMLLPYMYPEGPSEPVPTQPESPDVQVLVRMTRAGEALRALNDRLSKIRARLVI